MRYTVPVLLLLCLFTTKGLAHEPVAAAGRTLPAACAAATPLALNSATTEQFDTLPGIGPALASRIVAYRDEHGPFTEIDQLNNVKGIGLRTLEKLRPCLTLH